MKLNVVALRRKPPTYFTRKLPISVPPGELEFRMKKPEPLDGFKAQDVARDLCDRYIDQGLPFPPFGPGAEEIEVTESVAQGVAPIFVLQAPLNPNDAYSPEELIWIAATEPEYWMGMQKLLYEVQNAKPAAAPVESDSDDEEAPDPGELLAARGR